MLLLIDGYNLLHQSDLLGRGRGEDWLRRARNRLLRQLAKHLDDSLRPQTCIVFDAEDPPPGRPSQISYHEIDVRFAVNHPEADDLLEEIIAQHPAANRLTVVSSDHRVQRAIQRRRGHFFDSDDWYASLTEAEPVLGIRNRKPSNPSSKSRSNSKESLIADLAAQSTEEWLQEFGLTAASTSSSVSPPSQPPAESHVPSSNDDARPPAGKRKKVPAAPEHAASEHAAAEHAATEHAATEHAAPPKTVSQPTRKHPPKKLASKPKASKPPTSVPKPTDATVRKRTRRQLEGEARGIFPEGYGEDLL